MGVSEDRPAATDLIKIKIKAGRRTREVATDYERERSKLVDAAARAAEQFDEDELERYAEKIKEVDRLQTRWDEGFYRHPGKFEACGPVGEYLYDLVGEGGQDEEIGSVDELGWYGLFTDTGLKCAPHAILREDSQGFVEVERIDDRQEALDRWGNVLIEYEVFDDDYPDVDPEPPDELGDSEEGVTGK